MLKLGIDFKRGFKYWYRYRSIPAQKYLVLVSKLKVWYCPALLLLQQCKWQNSKQVTGQTINRSTLLLLVQPYSEKDRNYMSFAEYCQKLASAASYTDLMERQQIKCKGPSLSDRKLHTRPSPRFVGVYWRNLEDQKIR